MNYFKYTGRTEKGDVKRGTIESSSRNQAIQDLRAMGIRPREVVETKPSFWNREISFTSSRVKQQDFIVYCRQFATLIRAGISIVDATNILAEQTASKRLKQILQEVQAEIRSGRSFSDAVNDYPKVFPPLFVNMVRSGEMTGNLDETLDRLASYFEKQYSLKKKVQSTLAYPVILLIVILVVVTFLMVVIVPNFITIFDQFDSELPGITQLLVTISLLVQKYWWLGLLIIGIGMIALMLLWRQNKTFHYGVHVMLLKMPIFGPLLQKAAIARMTRTLSSLFSSSVPILPSLGIVAKVVNNPVIEKVVLEARSSLESGNSLAQPFERSWVFPPLVAQMTAIGEQSGTLDFMLEKVADFYEEDVDRTVDTLRSLIEPLMIILLAVVVGFIVLSIMIPMLSVFSDIQ